MVGCGGVATRAPAPSRMRAGPVLGRRKQPLLAACRGVGVLNRHSLYTGLPSHCRRRLVSLEISGPLRVTRGSGGVLENKRSRPRHHLCPDTVGLTGLTLVFGN